MTFLMPFRVIACFRWIYDHFFEEIKQDKKLNQMWTRRLFLHLPEHFLSAIEEYFFILRLEVLEDGVGGVDNGK